MENYKDYEVRKCEMCSTCVAYKKKKGPYKTNEFFGCQVGKSNKYPGEIASLCKKHCKTI